MKTHTLIKRAASVALLSSTLALPAVVGLTAGTANAVPIQVLASECGSANGTWVTDFSINPNGSRTITGYQCFYKDIGGDQYVDYYDRRGNYKGTS